jgi:hypothetical protein
MHSETRQDCSNEVRTGKPILETDESPPRVWVGFEETEEKIRLPGALETSENPRQDWPGEIEFSIRS